MEAVKVEEIGHHHDIVSVMVPWQQISDCKLVRSILERRQDVRTITAVDLYPKRVPCIGLRMTD